MYSKGVFTWENSHRHEFHTAMAFWFRIAFTEWPAHFISRYLKVYTPWWENTCVIQSRKHYACATRCSLPADRFHTKCFVVSHWNDTVVMFRTGVNFSPRYIKQGELTPEVPHMRGSWTNADELTFSCHY